MRGEERAEGTAGEMALKGASHPPPWGEDNSKHTGGINTSLVQGCFPKNHPLRMKIKSILNQPKMLLKFD